MNFFKFHEFRMKVMSVSYTSVTANFEMPKSSDKLFALEEFASGAS